MLLVTLLGGPLLVAAMPPVPDAGPVCQPAEALHVTTEQERMRPRRLADASPGQPILALFRTGFDRCNTPVPVSARLGKR